MTNIREIARKSAEIYYDFATQKRKSAVEYPVRSILPVESGFELYVTVPIRSLDNLLVQIKGNLYEESEIRILEYDPEKKMIRVFAEKKCAELLKTASAEDVLLISDLRFLIRRVKEWYEEYGSLVKLPKGRPSIWAYHPTATEKIPSEDQMAAIEGVFKSPFTYVWGAPGTGKTQMVLARCIMSYIKQRKKILITAPTNRALEQVLNGVLPVLEESGIEQNTVLRMGIPTKEFAEKYPVVCENHQLLQKVKEVELMLGSAREKFRRAERLAAQYQKFKNYLEWKALFEKADRDGMNALERLERIALEITESRRRQAELLTEMRSLKAKGVVLQEELVTGERELSRARQKKERYSKGIFHKVFPHLYEKFAQMEEELEKTLRVLGENVCANEQRLEEIRVAQEDENKKYLMHEAEAESQRNLLETVWPVLRELDLLEFDDIDNTWAIKEAIFKGRILFSEKQQKYKDLDPNAVEDSVTERDRLAERIAELERTMEQMMVQKNVRLSHCLVMASTIDGCLTKVLPDGDFKPDHVFLDEAGYASLIKGAALTAYHCPITLLGDHMQLPPVCEVNDWQLEEEELQPVVLWAQSSLYLEELFKKDFSQICFQYFKHQLPAFDDLKKFDLVHSYRMGTRLASVLAGEVYSSRLIGTTEHQTEIFYINTPARLNRPKEGKEVPKRYNEAECRAISKFIGAHADLEIGVITPYKNQKEALRRLLPEEIEVNTIHGSQGREWDCVMISVVDSTDKWFTDSLSKISNGKNIINTAVSRAKKYLILVCDAEYWASQEKQLLGKLISIGREIH